MCSARTGVSTDATAKTTIGVGPKQVAAAGTRNQGICRTITSHERFHVCGVSDSHSAKASMSEFRYSSWVTGKPEVMPPVGRLLPINAPAVTNQSLEGSRLHRDLSARCPTGLLPNRRETGRNTEILTPDCLNSGMVSWPQLTSWDTDENIGGDA
jgi:hypothetical protein